MNIKEKRFSQKKDGSWSDNFMLTYLQLKLASETKISVFNRKLKGFRFYFLSGDEVI